LSGLAWKFSQFGIHLSNQSDFSLPAKKLL
jgi:hypothetical protein